MSADTLLEGPNAIAAVRCKRGIALVGRGGTVVLPRALVGQIVEFLIAVTDVAEPDPDLEEDDPGEDEHDREAIDEREPDHDAEAVTWAHPDDHPPELHIGRRPGYTDEPPEAA